MLELFLVVLRLGLTSFGGPAAHLGYFQAEFVERRRWLSSAQFADLVALAQFLPGSSSSQVNLSIGFLHAGPLGALLAWAGFTLPSVLVLLGAAQHRLPLGVLTATLGIFLPGTLLMLGADRAECGSGGPAAGGGGVPGPYARAGAPLGGSAGGNAAGEILF